MAVESARLSVETRYWPLYEIENGSYKINYKPKDKLPIKDWVLSQGRFAHLKNEKWQSVLDDFQKEVDSNWEWLLKQEGV